MNADLAVVEFSARGIAYAELLLTATQHKTALKNEASTFKKSWTVLPSDCKGVELPDPDRGIWEKLGRRIAQKEVDSCVDSVYELFVKCARMHPQSGVYFIDPFFRGKALELEDGTYTSPVDQAEGKGHCYSLPKAKLTLYNIDVLAEFCCLEWAGGGVVANYDGSQIDNVLYFLSGAFDRESRMICSTVDEPLPNL